MAACVTTPNDARGVSLISLPLPRCIKFLWKHEDFFKVFEISRESKKICAEIAKGFCWKILTFARWCAKDASFTQLSRTQKSCAEILHSFSGHSFFWEILEILFRVSGTPPKWHMMMYTMVKTAVHQFFRAFWSRLLKTKLRAISRIPPDPTSQRGFQSNPK